VAAIFEKEHAIKKTGQEHSGVPALFDNFVPVKYCHRDDIWFH